MNGRKLLNAAHDRLDLGNSFYAEMLENLKEAVQVSFDFAMVFAEIVADECGGGISFRSGGKF